MATISLGLVGLPNAGKSTLFNALIETNKALVAEYPFSTIEPNKGILLVKNLYLDKIAEVAFSKKILPPGVEIIDIAGLIKDAHKGEGLGNQFLSYIRECQVIILVTRAFQEERVIHPEGELNPLRDIETLLMELLFADLELVENILEKLKASLKRKDKEKEELYLLINKVKEKLTDCLLLVNYPFTAEEKLLLKPYNLLTLKPIIYVININEKELDGCLDKNFLALEETFSYDSDFLRKNIKKEEPFLHTAALLEAEMKEWPEEERLAFLKELKRAPIENLLTKAVINKLNLITFFTANENEARGYLIEKGTSAYEAAGLVHTDFQKKFIAVEVASAKDFIAKEGWQGVRKEGMAKIKGRDYFVEDGDVLLFKVGK